MNGSRRFHVLDSLRGFAIAGILLVNVPDMTRLGRDVPVRTAGSASIAQLALDYLVGARFVPIFMFLFGMSLMFVRDGARCRGRRPWVVLLRRLGVLFLVGCAHGLVYPGEVLRLYAVCGLVLIPAIVLLPGRVLLWGGALTTLAAYALTGGGVATMPGIFLLGAGAVAAGWPGRLERAGRDVAVIAVLAAVASMPALLWQAQTPGDPRFTDAGGIAGGALAMLYTTGIALLLSTAAGRIVRAVFEPLGRMAFTCYVTASLVAVPVGAALGFRASDDVVPALLLAGTILTVQTLCARWWLTAFTYGPLEWVWRCLTWWQAVPLRRRVMTPE